LGGCLISCIYEFPTIATFSTVVTSSFLDSMRDFS
jgi:hypothetical protein